MQPGPDYKPAEIESVFIYEKNGQKKEFSTTTIPWQDSTWKYVDRKDKTIKEATGEPEIHDFILTDSDKNDQTKAVLTAQGYTIFWFVRNPQGPHLEKLDQISKLAAKARELHIPFYCLCSADMETSMAFMKKIGMANIPVFTLDGTASKTAMRTDPGLMVIKDGLVVQKWSYRDYPQDMTLNNGKLDIK